MSDVISSKLRTVPALSTLSVVAQVYESGSEVWVSMSDHSITAEDAHALRDWLNSVLPDETTPPRPVVYSPCEKHAGLCFTMSVGPGAAPIVKCPICEPPPMHPMAPLGDSVRSPSKTEARTNQGDSDCVMPDDKCEHGIPRRFCTAAHGSES